MEKIRELLGRLDSLTDEEIQSLKTDLLAEFDRIFDEPTTAENVAALNELSEAGAAIKGQIDARAAAAAEAEQAKSAAAEAMKGLRETEEAAEETTTATADGDEPAEGESEEGEEPEGDDEPAEGAEATESTQEVAVTASSGVAAVGAALRGRKPDARPERTVPAKTGRPRVMVASAFGGYEETDDRMTIAKAMCDRLSRMPKGGPPQGIALCASAEWDYPEERDLRGKDMYEVTALMEAATGIQAIRASGGICLPVNVDYDIPTWATAARPLKEGLPAYQATRGGLRFVEPPDVGALGAATGIWTEATDAEPLAATKPVFSVSCGTEILVYVNAVSTRVGFGNMQSRFQPELVAANTDLAIAAAARKAELKLLELINEKCTKDITSGKVLGATRDLVTAIQQAVAFFRYYHRLPADIGMTAIFPEWLKSVIKIDMARESAHQQGDGTTSWNSLMITDQQVEDLLSTHGVKPIWMMDSLESANSGASENQNLILQAGTGAINTFPKKCVWNLFPEGSMQFLDGGRLDLGVVRDSTLDATNDYETFVETFEGIADRGFAHSAQQFVSEFCANGKSGATETVSSCA